MPTYGYQCTRCDNAFETVQKMSDDPLTKCDNCGGELKKKIYPVGISFKGTGFYVNDYASTKPAETSASPAVATDSKVESTAAPAAAESTSSGDSTAAAAPAPAATPAIPAESKPTATANK